MVSSPQIIALAHIHRQWRRWIHPHWPLIWDRRSNASGTIITSELLVAAISRILSSSVRGISSIDERAHSMTRWCHETIEHIHSRIIPSSIVCLDSSVYHSVSQDDSAEYRLFYRAFLQKRPVIVRRLRIESVYHWGHHKMRAHIHSEFVNVWMNVWMSVWMNVRSHFVMAPVIHWFDS